MGCTPRVTIAARRAWAALALVLGLGACGGAPEPERLQRLERLVFMPAGSCVLFAGTPGEIDCSGERPLLVDRFEVTRREWEKWTAGDEVDAPGLAARGFWRGECPDCPATGMTLDEASAFAADQEMRLPTAAEWVRAAAGSRAQAWPWGPYPVRSAANTLELGLDRLAPGGSFDSGRTSLGIHDLLGNAAEWVLGRLDPLAGSTGDEDRAWAMGGSYRRYKRETYRPGDDGSPRFNAELLDPRSRSEDVGLRLVADAEDWLRAEAGSWPGHAEARARRVALGQSWGRGAAPLLRRLAAELPEAPGLLDLLEGALAPEGGR